MTEPRPPLGVGTLLARCFSVFFLRFPLIAIAAALPLALVVGAGNFALGTLSSVDTMSPLAVANPFFRLGPDEPAFFIQVGLLCLGFGVATSAVVHTCRAPSVLSARFLTGLLTTIRKGTIGNTILGVFVILGFSGVIALAVGVAESGGGVMVMIVLLGGIIALLTFLAGAPAAASVEGRWAGALTRSWTLIAGYRWQVFLILTVGVFTSFALSFGMIAAFEFTGTFNPDRKLADFVALLATLCAFPTTMAALIHERLVVIKEGRFQGDLAEVFG